jgi:FkbM family methyltransferase
MNLATFFLLVRSSLFLDWMMLRKVRTKVGIPFLFHKYILLALPWAHKNRLKNAYMATMIGRQIFLPTTRDISAIQSNFIAHSYLESYIHKGATVIDIGAHIGQFNIFCRSYLHAISVFSFEPIQSSYDFLALNATTGTYHEAVSNKDYITMHVPSYTQLATIFPEGHENYIEKVSCVSIDMITEIQQLVHIDLLKIDVEGMEREVLETCIKTLQKTKYLLVEISLERQQSTSSVETLSYIHQLLPQAELIRITNICVSADYSKQEAVDMLFRITDA